MAWFTHEMLAPLAQAHDSNILCALFKGSGPISINRFYAQHLGGITSRSVFVRLDFFWSLMLHIVILGGRFFF